MDYYETQSTQMPLEVDTESSKIYNYVRRNIRHEEVEGMDGETVTMYYYEEAKIRKEDWGLYEETAQQRSDIDYMAAMMDIDL